ncbi:hypothetical protein A2801_00425 [Candidatus Woesebacteria bacterium RIFCSPHIGHO2_01_FULL_41_10]|uniref:rRNA maturation RNase YbeY n=1 Tax=Candidatus Woesebacteria bacterium RIFCSPHIGHO2_01_FULL_41_10 TaxID=1802500 RepID=A0A1F7YRX5_9BACT|nr:MAG: hypothetical protein A2801_00425 [Candidatus Woesebacteria bacterium RIFCSPHIGHO2_01_FULL_41_10]
MNTVHIEYTAEYQIEEQSLKEAVTKLLESSGKRNANIVVVITNNETLANLAIQYMKETPEEAKNHPVLSFPTGEIEGGFVFPPKIHYLGEVLVSMDWISKEVQNTGKAPQDLVIDMALHGTLHLLGIHHD